MSGHVDGIVDAPQDPEITVVVDLRAVAGVKAAEAAEIALVLLLVVEHAKHHAGPRLADDQVAGAAAFGQVLAVASGGAHDRGVDAGQGEGGRTGLELGGVRQRADHGAAGLRLPPGVHDGQLAAADVLVVPLPGFGIDGFAHRAQHAQGAQVITFRPGLAHAHERTDDRGRGIEDVDPEFFHDAPVAVGLGPVGHALEHHGRGAQGQRAVNAVGMAGDPAHVGRAPVHVVVAHVEYPLRGMRRIGEVAARGMHDARGLAGAAAGMQEEERIVGVHGLAGEVHVQREILDEVMPPDVAVGHHLHVLKTGMAHDDHMRHGGALLEDGVKVALERLDAARTDDAVGRDDHFGLGALDAAAHAALGITGKDGGMHRADARTGQHGDDQFRDHGHVQGHAVALAHPQRAQGMRHPADFRIQHLVGEAAHIHLLLALPDERRLVAAAGIDMPVDAVEGSIELGIGEPSVLVLFVVRIKDLVPALVPVDKLRSARPPEVVGIFKSPPANGFSFILPANPCT